jgi:ribose-phosphate pyrophosphokinase
MDHLTAVPILADYLKTLPWDNAAIVAPDTGRVKLADQYARALGLPLVILYKRRRGPQDVETAFVVGSVEGKCPIIVDDMISTGITVERAIAALIEAGAREEVTVVATHGLLDDGAVQRLNQPAVKAVIITNTVALDAEKTLALPNLRMVSIAPLIAETIQRLNSNRSISALFTSYDANYAV